MSASDCEGVSKGTASSILSFDDAREKLLASAKSLSKTQLILATDALGKVLAEDVYASCHVPPQDNSAMDGFALRCADWQQGKALPLSQKIFAGAAPLVLLEGTAVRLFTGSVVPEGADAVVLQEDCEFNDAHVVINEMPVTGQHIRRAGEDIQKGQLLLSKGVRLAAKHIGYLVAAGVTYVNVYEALKVGLLATGDEICEPGTQLAIGQIYNSNLYMLKAELEQLGCVVQAMFERDDVDKISDAFLVLCSENDVVLSIGGVSVGDADFVKQAISRRGSLSMWKVAMKPGKPLSFGCMLDKPVMGLPGNPVSAFATFHLFAKPFLQTMQGLQQACSESMFYPLHLDRALQPKREEFLRVRKVLLNGEWWLMPFQHQGSGVLSSVVWASGFARVPMNALTQHGDQVAYWEF